MLAWHRLLIENCCCVMSLCQTSLRRVKGDHSEPSVQDAGFADTGGELSIKRVIDYDLSPFFLG